ncbi:unnamed protein product [Paramecium sonneborni]|uniref:Uncharacterized protein n=1 Tax=Paramecium sonneborni TaxID=65129 RepID=A0A8S1QGJ8_9CILI|nr:unnamed protein product [Paramecium sonneborni]
MGGKEQWQLVFEGVWSILSLICNVFGFPWDSIFLYIQVSLIINRLGTQENEIKTKTDRSNKTSPDLQQSRSIHQCRRTRSRYKKH